MTTETTGTMEKLLTECRAHVEGHAPGCVCRICAVLAWVDVQPAASRASPEAEPETVIRCEETTPAGTRCGRFAGHGHRDHDKRGHSFGDSELNALWNGLDYWHRVAKRLEAEGNGRASPEEGRAREVLREIVAAMQVLDWSSDRTARQFAQAVRDRLAALRSPPAPAETREPLTERKVECPRCLHDFTIIGPPASPPTEDEGARAHVPPPCATCTHFRPTSCYVGRCSLRDEYRVKTDTCYDHFVEVGAPASSKDGGSHE